MAHSLVDIIRFKQEINELMDECIDILKNNQSENCGQLHLMRNTINYYDRMKAFYSSKQSDDDDDVLINDSLDETDYTYFMKDRVSFNHNNLMSYKISEREIKNSMCYTNTSLSYNEFDQTDDLDYFDDSSADSPFYDIFNSNMENEDDNAIEEEDDEEPGDPTVNNTKKTLKPFLPDTDLEILNGPDSIDYNEPMVE